jgi:hypothetical protein
MYVRTARSGYCQRFEPRGLPNHEGIRLGRLRPSRCRGVFCGQELYRKARGGFAKVAEQCFSLKLRLQEFLLWTKMVEQLPSLLE